MKRLLLLLAVSTSASALEQGDYGYGYTYHGYNSLEQQQEAQYNAYSMQQTNQNIVDLTVNQRLNGGQPPEHFSEFDYSNADIYGQE
jgi:hypothetical protein